MAEEYVPDWAKPDSAPAKQEYVPDWAKPAGERSVGQRALEAAGETFTAGAQHAADLFTKKPELVDVRDPSTYLAPLKNIRDVGLGVISPLTMTLGAATSAVASPIASALGWAERKHKQETGQQVPTSEEAYEKYRLPTEIGLSLLPLPTGKTGPLRYTRPGRSVEGKGNEAVAGRYLEQQAEDPMMARYRLSKPADETIPGDLATTYQQTRDPGLGAAERSAETRHAEDFRVMREQQNARRLEVLAQLKGTGSPEEVAQHLRNMMRDEDITTEAAVTAARQQALEAQQRLGPN